ncbi:MAG TPA: flagellar filament capping protein FliD, partial [Acidimicrobiales bacterium]|nr:flagellar filament capping protein FliD [Acidimicrobiales bacterium]
MSLSSSGTSGTPPVVSYGMVSGINTQQIIQAELQPFEIPINSLQAEQSTLTANIGDYQQISSDMVAMKSAADTLARSSGWNARSATSSDSGVATATAAAGTPLGSVQFSVLQLAAANSLVSSGTASSTSQIITGSSSLLLSEGASQLGFATLSAGTGVAMGDHTVSVTQSSQAATLAGNTDLQSQTSGINITSGSNDTLNVTVGTTAYSLVLAGSPAGGYSGSQLLSAVNSAISAAGAAGVLQAGYDSSGHLVLATVDQGSTQSLQINNGSALSTLGLSAGTATGVDAVVNVDGTANTISTVAPGAALTLNGPAGETISATLGGSSGAAAVGSSLITAGSVTAHQVSTGSGSLSDVVNAINSAGAGMVASAVQTGTNQYVLQVSSSSTGTGGDLSIDPTAFAGSPLGSLKTAVAGQDGEIQVGGPGGYTISSQNNTFTGLLPGLSITAQQVSSNPVTVTVGSDASAIAGSVKSLVDDANTVLSDIQKYAGYNQATKKGGPLMGSAILQGLTNSVLGAFASAVGTSNVGSAASVGIKIDNGQISFDQTAFQSAFNADPSQVQNLFTQGAGFTPNSAAYTGQVQFSYASNTTAAGSYDVSISQAATQASASGSTLSTGSVGSGETLNIAMGSTSATFTTSSGQSLASIASGLNSAFAAQGMGLTARVNGNALQLIASGYGSASSFTVTSSNPAAAGSLGLTGGAASQTFSGMDVAGTINGVAATGSGQFLSAPVDDPTLGGLSLQVTATSAGDLGTVKYAPGLAQALSNLAYQSADPVHGSITQTVQGLQNQNVSITPQIQMYQTIVDEQQKLLMAKYATMEATLGGLK